MERTETLTSHVFPADDWLFNVADAQIVHEEAFRHILIIHVPCQTVCIVNSVNCPEGEGYVLLSNRSEHGRLEAVFGAD